MYSYRFGFVTFATHDDVQNVLSQGPVFFKGKKINVGPAVKRMVRVHIALILLFEDTLSLSFF